MGAITRPQARLRVAATARPTGPALRAEERSASLYLVYIAWVMVLFDPHYLAAAVAGQGAGKLATLIYLALLGMLLLRIPDNVARGRLWVLYPAYLVWLVSGLFSLPVAINVGLVRDCLKILLLYWAVTVATPDIVRTPRAALPILSMFAFRFAWWEGWAGASGQIFWHPSLYNYDGYGALAAQGAGICYWMAMGARKRGVKIALFVLAAIAVVGVVSTAARGAFLALMLVAAIIWLRSPRKGLTLAAMIGAAIVVAIAAMTLFEGSAFFDEIMSSFEEGTESGTGQQRWELWTTAMRVFKEHWLFGVGAGNVGIYAATIVQPGELALFPNPSMLWGYNMHNSYVQVLAEWGIVGSLAFVWLHIDFFIKNRALRQPEAIALWEASGAGRTYSLLHVSLALEAGFLALMLTNMVYANLFEAWLVAFWALGRALWGATRAPKARQAPRRGRGVRGAAGTPASPPRPLQAPTPLR